MNEGPIKTYVFPMGSPQGCALQAPVGTGPYCALFTACLHASFGTASDAFLEDQVAFGCRAVELVFSMRQRSVARSHTCIRVLCVRLLFSVKRCENVYCILGRCPTHSLLHVLT